MAMQVNRLLLKKGNIELCMAKILWKNQIFSTEQLGVPIKKD